ncbi:putative transcription factor [Corchorus olitorius]|uniref:Transcription factor n=1 Tax=Corchorus olitorius TaxID=93759 RepID=A0A1R3I5F7_9ROSI|nr:putative transcription factor [Corchorus olitorius]
MEDDNLNTSSSDVTQGTPNETLITDDYQYEANSAANNMCSFATDFSSSLIQEMQIPGTYTNVHYQVPYPPLELEDFPEINISETKPSKAEIIDEYMIYDKYRDHMNGSLEEIFSLCSSHIDNSISLPMQD